MKNNIVLIPLLLSFTLMVSSCQMQGIKNSTNEQHQKIPVVTTSNILTIHAKMIARDDAFVVTLDENKKSISNAEKELIY